MRSSLLLLPLLALGLAACGSDAPPEAPPTGPAVPDATNPTAAPADPAATAPPPAPDSAALAAQAATPTDAWVLSHEGYGPLRVGMTQREMNAIAGKVLPLNPGVGCSFAVFTRPNDQEVAVMVAGGRVARIDVRYGSGVKTVEGAGIGNRPEEIEQLYPGTARRPNPFDREGLFLVAPVPGDSARSYLFEVDAIGKVTKVRSSTEPAARCTV